MIDQELIKQSDTIFNTLDKWNALAELQRLENGIVQSWLVHGTNQLWKHFDQNLSDRWRWEQWGGKSWDTHWYLADFGIDSLAIGFWDYEFHFCVRNWNRFDSKRIAEELKGEYAKLLIPFGMNPHIGPGKGYGQRDSFAVEDRNFPFGSSNDTNLSLRELAWYARHDTRLFVDLTAAKIQLFTRKPEVTEMLYKLNEIADTTRNRT